MAASKLKAVKYISQLNAPEYAELAMKAARNLGGSPRDVSEAIRWLETNAMETDEKGVVREINACR